MTLRADAGGAGSAAGSEAAADGAAAGWVPGAPGVCDGMTGAPFLAADPAEPAGPADPDDAADPEGPDGPALCSPGAGGPVLAGPFVPAAPGVPGPFGGATALCPPGPRSRAGAGRCSASSPRPSRIRVPLPAVVRNSSSAAGILTRRGTGPAPLSPAGGRRPRPPRPTRTR
ncbi:hypothetical protein ACFQ9X_39985 [Catenulispora yoronensis]